jgi:hypothetical protein
MLLYVIRLLVTIILGSATLVCTFSLAYAQSDIGIISSSDYLDKSGAYHIVGEIQNNSGKALQFTEITAMLYDKNNAMVSKSVGYALIDVLEPGEKSPFHLITLESGQAHNIASYKLSFNTTAATEKPKNLQVSLANGYTDVNGAYHLVGEITNHGDKNSTYVEVDAAFYDTNNKVIDVSTAYTNPKEIVPGAKEPFEIVSSAPNSNQIKTFSVNAESVEYSKMPEFGVPLVAFVTTLAGITVFSRFKNSI